VTKPDAALPDKATLLARLEEERGDWERLLVEVGLPRMTQPGVDGDWSVKDIMAHVAAYERWTAGHVAAVTRGDAPTLAELYGSDDVPPGVDAADTDERNAAIAAWYRGVSLDEVSVMAQQTFTALVDAVQAAPEELLSDPRALDWLDGTTLTELIIDNSYRHYSQHAPAIRAWIMRSEGLPSDATEPVEPVE
jgi:hypothetical protein